MGLAIDTWGHKRIWERPYLSQGLPVQLKPRTPQRGNLRQLRAHTRTVGRVERLQRLGHNQYNSVATQCMFATVAAAQNVEARDVRMQSSPGKLACHA